MFKDRERIELDRPTFDAIEFTEEEERFGPDVATAVEEPAGDEPLPDDELDVEGAIGLRDAGRRRSDDEEEGAEDDFEEEEDDDALDEALDEDFDDEFEEDDDLDDDLEEEEEEEEL